MKLGEGAFNMIISAFLPISILPVMASIPKDFAGYRDFEIDWKINGLSYKEIAGKGGGIKYTVNETKKQARKE